MGVLARGHGRLRVGIDGLTAAGKTSFGDELAGRICRTGRPVLRTSLDDFKRPWRDRHRYDRESGEGYYRNAFDYEAVKNLLLEPAGVNGSGECVLCSIDPLTQADHSNVVTPATPDAVLIVDGVFAFRPDINRYWDFRVWLDIDPELAVRRGVQRDLAGAGQDAEAVHCDRYQAAERVYLVEVDPVSHADIVVDNTRFDEPRIVRERC
ncbi:uridine kinase [Micromonospora inyonensis]|uniref:Uridine kinase n=2 Tax=Micromonospora inyonensis TaxID=47866 RepID=A0A1C6RQH1_9ACTN|nr:uridine kinase [Micromonospora inyonensis]